MGEVEGEEEEVEEGKRCLRVSWNIDRLTAHLTYLLERPFRDTTELG